jgi:hypothetical protein
MNEEMMMYLYARKQADIKLLYDARQLLIKALEASGVNVTGWGFGMGEGGIDVEIDGRNFCITLKVTDLDRASTKVVKRFTKNFTEIVGEEPEDVTKDLFDAGDR